MNKLLTLSVLLSLVACTQPDKASRILSEQGYKDIVAEGYTPFGCSDDDTFHTKFVATSPSGHRVTGVVCSGVFKGSTIRLD